MPIRYIIKRQGCSQWAWAISSGISHHSNMHEWEITTEWGAITSPKSVRVRWHYLAGWEPLLSWGFPAPEEWGEVNYCGGNRPFVPCLWHEDISLESEGLKCSKNCKAWSIIRFLFSSTIDFCCRDDLFLWGGLSKLQLRTKKAAYQVVETAQGIIYIWSGNWWHNTAYCDRHAAAGGYG